MRQAPTGAAAQWGTVSMALSTSQTGAHTVGYCQPVRQGAHIGALSTVHSNGTDNQSDRVHTVGYTGVQRAQTPNGVYIGSTANAGTGRVHHLMTKARETPLQRKLPIATICLLFL